MFNQKLNRAIKKRKLELKEEKENQKKIRHEQDLQRQLERLETKGMRRQQRNEVKQIMKVAASEMKELEEEDSKSKK